MRTRQQKWAETAYKSVQGKKGKSDEEDYGRFCKSFPALLHTAGLCQALAFAGAKGHRDYLGDLSGILEQNSETLQEMSRTADVLEYQRLSREAMFAATWLKRYAEALLKEAD